MSEVTATLKNWEVVAVPDTNFYVIIGTCYGDTRNRFPDGEVIRTSGINKDDYPIDSLDCGSVVKTFNSTYQLED